MAGEHTECRQVYYMGNQIIQLMLQFSSWAENSAAHSVLLFPFPYSRRRKFLSRLFSFVPPVSESVPRTISYPVWTLKDELSSPMLISKFTTCPEAPAVLPAPYLGTENANATPLSLTRNNF